jgi:hypothetical protein
MDQSQNRSLSRIKAALAGTPLELLPHLFGPAPVGRTSLRLLRYVRAQAFDESYLGDPYPRIKVMLQAALHNRWEEFTSLEPELRTDAITGIGWAIWLSEERLRERHRVRCCSKPGIMWAAVCLSADDYATELCWGKWPIIAILRHFRYGVLQGPSTALLERLVRLRAIAGHIVELIPSLMLLWSLEERTGIEVNLPRIIREREQAGLQASREAYRGHSWYWSEEHVASSFSDHLAAYEEPDRRAAVLARLVQTWRSLGGEEAENGTESPDRSD